MDLHDIPPLEPRFQVIKPETFPSDAEYVGPFSVILERMELTEAEFRELGFEVFSRYFQLVFKNRELQIALVKRNGMWEYLTFDTEVFVFMRFIIEMTGPDGLDAYIFTRPANEA